MAQRPMIHQPQLLKQLPRGLENATALLRRRQMAVQRKALWLTTYSEAYRYTMPMRENFFSTAEGQRSNQHLYDSTAADAVITAANLMQETLAPTGREWGTLVPGADVEPEDAASPEVQEQLQEQTDKMFSHLAQSNFDTVVHETLLDVQVGTGGLQLDEGDDPILMFSSMPLSAIELEEGPNGMVCTIWSCKELEARNVPLTWRGYQPSPQLTQTIARKPETKVALVVGQVYDFKTQRYYGVVIEEVAKHIGWRYDYGDTGPIIVARALVRAGELYGRGPVLSAMPDIKTLNKLVQDLLTHNALQNAPPLTATTDGVLNPFTIRLSPLTVIPVGSNATANPSLAALQLGGDFVPTESMIKDLRESVRRKLLADSRRNDGPVETAFEVAVEDRDLLRMRGAMYGRVRGELLGKVAKRVVAILTRRGKMAPLKINGREVSLKWKGPLARAQDHEDILVFDRVLASCGPLGPEVLMGGLKVEDAPAWLARKAGLDAKLVRSPTERKQLLEVVAQIIAKSKGADGAA
jgi:hypothetical protein